MWRTGTKVESNGEEKNMLIFYTSVYCLKFLSRAYMTFISKESAM